MAEAIRNEKVIKVVQEESITLTLSLEEAEIVRSMAGTAYLSNSSFKGGASSVYRSLSRVLGGFAEYEPVECEDNTVTWKRKRA